MSAGLIFPETSLLGLQTAACLLCPNMVWHLFAFLEGHQSDTVKPHFNVITLFKSSPNTTSFWGNGGQSFCIWIKGDTIQSLTANLTLGLIGSKVAFVFFPLSGFCILESCRKCPLSPFYEGEVTITCLGEITLWALAEGWFGSPASLPILFLSTVLRDFQMLRGQVDSLSYGPVHFA